LRLRRKEIVALMMRFRNRVFLKGKSTFERIDRFVVKHYIAYNILIAIYTLIGIPLLLRFSEDATLKNLSAVPFFALSIISVIEMEEVAERNPYAFIKVEKLKHWVSLAFWLLLTSLFVCLGLMMFFAKQLQEEQILTLLNVFLWLVVFFIAVSLYSALFSGASLAGYLTKILPRIKARACFRIVSNALSSRNPQEQKKKLSFFEEGMKNYNEYLKGRFGFMIRERKRYYNYFKLAILSENDDGIDRIRQALVVLALQLEKDMRLMDVLWAPKRVVGENVSDIQDIYSEVDFEVGLRKWFSSHQNTIKFIIVLASLVISLIRFMQ